MEGVIGENALSFPLFSTIIIYDKTQKY